MQNTKQIKKYKPGQFVSIDGKLARVYRYNPTFCACDCCEAVNGKCLCNKSPNKSECAAKLGLYQYPKLIKQCGNQDK